MLFNVEVDAGFLVKGYAVPDAYDKYCVIVVRSGGKEITTIVADGPRDGGMVGGRHVDSQCGFSIDETRLPNLSQLDDLELRDEDTNVLIYRRNRADFVRKKILRLESHLLPLWRLDKPLNPRFQYAATQFERFGYETISQIVALIQYDSTYIAGRVMYPSIRRQVEDVFKVVFIMHHPYEELAERLLVLRQIPESGGGILAARDVGHLAPVIAFAKSLPLEDQSALPGKLREMRGDVARLVANPVVRQLTCERMDDAPGLRALSSSLDILASFELVGLRRATTPVLLAVAGLTEMSVNMLPPLPTLPGVTDLAKALRRSREFEYLLELDLQLYAQIAEAYRKTLAPRPTIRDIGPAQGAVQQAALPEQAAHG